MKTSEREQRRVERTARLGTLGEINALLLQQQQENFTGRLLVTVDFNQGGVRRLRVEQLVNQITLHPKEG